MSELPETPNDDTDAWPDDRQPEPPDPATLSREDLEATVVRLREQLARAEERSWELWQVLQSAPRPREWPKSPYWHWWVARWRVLTGWPMPESLIHLPEPRPFVRRDRHG